MSTFDSLQQDNPNIRQQYDDWRNERAGKGEDPTDWDAFRDLVMYIGAPDPGVVPPDDFVSEEWKAENPDWVARYAGREQA
ncbi:MAG: hypothetical protein ACKVVP_04415 [Chloroflexota bacterium]